MAIINGLCALYASDHTWSLFLLIFLNQSINLWLHCLHSSFWWLFCSQIPWPRWPSGCRRIACRRFFFSLLQSILCFRHRSTHCHFVKLRVHGVCTIQQQPYSFSKLLCSRRMYHSTTVWGKPYSFSKLSCLRRTYVPFYSGGANRILSVNFCVRNVHTIQQQCGANRILAVNRMCIHV